MNPEDIIDKWKYKERDVDASIEMWDSMAGQFSNFELPTWENDHLMKLISDKNLIDSNSRVLDVGCGAGKFSFALSKSVKYVTGIDLSPKMIEKAKEKKHELKINNVDFFIENWHDSNLDALGYKDKFDLVIANMTPAIRNSDTFLKLSEASKGFCILVKPIRRTDPVSDSIREMLKLERKMESSDMEMLYAFNILWLQGKLPEMYYEHEVWNLKKNMDEAYKLYANRMKSYRALTDREELKIKEYLESLSDDGFIEEKVETVKATLMWKVK